MLSLKAHALITAAIFFAIIFCSAGGSALHSYGYLPDSSAVQIAARVVFFSLTLALALSAVPLMVKLVVAGHVAIGNADRAPVRIAAKSETIIVLCLWGLMLAGLAVAMPAMIHDGFFDPDPATYIAEQPSRGTLVARPGMTVEEIRRRSTLPIKGKPEAVFADGTLFDFIVAESNISFQRCRYYYMTTSRSDRSRIANISIGTAQGKMSFAKADELDAALHQKLKADGWLVGYEVYRTEQDRVLHGGAARGPEGDFWLKDGTTLRIMRRRLDDPKPGEPAHAGDYIQFIELAAKEGYPWIERFEFAPPR